MNMFRARPILSVGCSGATLCDPVIAARVVDLSEAAGVDLLVLGDDAAQTFDPLVLAGWLAPRTRYVGLIPIVSVESAEPFHVARALSALDFLTNGRSGWRPVATGAKAGQGEDFIAATRSLWDSWDSDALIVDQASGIYLDSAKVRRGDHRGPHYRVLGPLNAARPPQGHPVLILDDSDPAWPSVTPDLLIIDPDGRQAKGGPRRLARLSAALARPARIETLYRSGFAGVHIVLTDPVGDLTALAARAPSGVAVTLRLRLGLDLAPEPRR